MIESCDLMRNLSSVQQQSWYNFSKSLHGTTKLRNIKTSSSSKLQENSPSYIYYYIILCNNVPLEMMQFATHESIESNVFRNDGKYYMRR